MIDKWLKKLELTDWAITLESLDNEQVLCDCPPEDCYFIGVEYDSDLKNAVIYHDRNLREEDIVHELLHVKYNDWSEDQVNAETKRLLNQNKDDEQIKMQTGNREIMTTRKLVNLMMRSSDTNPYSGKLSKKDNVLAAIELAKLGKEFADTGQMDEAMNIESSQWVEVISKLESKSLNE